jgi:hypothetical protein
MKLVKKDGKLLAFLPTWRLLILMGMYCASAIQIGAFIIFWVEQKPIHPIGKICLLVGSFVALMLGQAIGRKDRKRIKEAGAVLEVTRLQVPILILCVASVPGFLLVLVLIS